MKENLIDIGIEDHYHITPATNLQQRPVTVWKATSCQQKKNWKRAK